MPTHLDKTTARTGTGGPPAGEPPTLADHLVTAASTTRYTPVQPQVTDVTGDAETDPARGKTAMRALLAPVRTRLRLAVACQVLASLAAVAPVVALAELARTLLAPHTPTTGATVRGWVLLGVVAALLRFVFLLAAGGVSHLVDVDFQLHVRRRTAAHLGRLPLAWFTARNSGGVKKALQDDVEAMHHAVAHAMLDLTSAVVVPLASLAYLLWVDWRMTLVALLPLVLSVAIYAKLMSGCRPKMAAYDAALARLNGATVEFVEGIAVVKAFGETGRAHQRFRQAADEFADFFAEWVSQTQKSSATAQFMTSPAFVLRIILLGGLCMVSFAGLPPVDLLPFALLGLALSAPMRSLNHSAEQLRAARAAADRVAGLLDTPALPEAIHPDRPVGTQVSIRGVRFGYDEHTEVLRGVDAELAPGTVTALVGPSGSGKSTLAKLLPRFADPTSGLISIGGVDLRRMSTSDLYRQVGFVLQDVQLLRASVAENIRLGRPEADATAVEAAARAACIHERVLALPRGYDSVVGIDARFSGGEAQRVSIARALLADAPILVLDEATAFADPESEATIQRALGELVAGRTLLVIAHRLSTVTNADQILVLDGGRVVERGRHTELVAAGGRYAAMWAAHEGAPSTEENL